MWVSVTRLRLQSIRYLLPFLTDSRAISRQAQRSGGFVDGKLLMDRRLTFWTLTVWQNEACMRTFRASGAHAKAMPRLAQWCRDATVAGWEQPGADLPAWAEAHQRIQLMGRKSRVDKPSPEPAPIPKPRTLWIFETRMHKKPLPGKTATAQA